MKKKLFALLFFVPFLSFSQKQIDSHSGSWLMYFGNHKLNEKLSLHTEYQFRREDGLKNWQQSLMRIGLDYHLNKTTSVTAGYGWIVSFPYGKQPIDLNITENRIWQQFVSNGSVGRVFLNHRYRLEQRFIENASLDANNEKTVKGNSFKQRARYRIYASIPLNHSKMEDNTLFLGFYEEVFLGFGKGIAKNILEQNRLYAALGYKFNANTNVQFGYLNQFIVKSDAIKMERNHMLQLGISHNISFIK